MKRLICGALAVSVMLLSACKNETSSFDRRMRDYAVVAVPAPDLSGISDNGKEVLNLYRFAADEIDAMYWEQYFGDKSLMDTISDPVQREYAHLNYGPWDRLDGKSFVSGYADRLPGAGFYPADMTLEEFEALDDTAKYSPYTLLRRGADGSLEAVWYHDEYSAHIEKIVNYLKAAADITIKPSVKKYLLSKAEALSTDNYYASDIDWLDMADSKMDLVIGPDETVDDQLLGIKRSYEAFVLLKNEQRSAMLADFTSRIPELQKELPCADEYKAFEPGIGSNIFSCDAVYYAGQANAGVKVIALNLPFDENVQRDKGTRTILLENIINAKFNHIVHPTGNVILDRDYRGNLSSEAFFWNVVFREVAHGLGVKETVNGKGTVEQALGKEALVFEEMKANVLGAFFVCRLQEHFGIPGLFTKQDALTTFFTSLMRSERFGDGSALGRANIMVYNYLLEKGAFSRSKAGLYSLDFARMESAISELSALVLRTQALGDVEFAGEFEAKYSVRTAGYDEDVMNLGLENVPVDIRFAFGK